MRGSFYTPRKVRTHSCFCVVEPSWFKATLVEHRPVEILTIVWCGHYFAAVHQLVSAAWRKQSRMRRKGSSVCEMITRRIFPLFSPDVAIKLDEEGFVLPFTVNEDVHKR